STAFVVDGSCADLSDSVVSALDAGTGRTRWRYPGAFVGFAGDRSTVLVLAGKAEAGCREPVDNPYEARAIRAKTYVGLDWGSGTPRWSFTAPAGVDVVTDGHLDATWMLLLSTDGTVHLRDPVTGDTVRTGSVPELVEERRQDVLGV